MEPLGETRGPFIERGRGRRLVFVHGYPLNHEMWTPQLERLSEDFRVLLLDLPGYGIAGTEPVPDTLAGFAEAVHRRLQSLGPGPVTLVGHSFGGYVALELYRTHPEDFEAMILTNTRSEPDTSEAREKRLATIHRLGDPSQHLDVEATTRALVAPLTLNGDGSVVATVQAMVRAVPNGTITRTLKAIADRPDLTPVLARLRVRTLVLWGEEDQLIPPSQSQSMVALSEKISGIGIPGAGHLPSLEAPDRFNESVRDFLQQRAW